MSQNLRLDMVVNDITGLTGLKIIQTIYDGNMDSKSLAQILQCDEKIKKIIDSYINSDATKKSLFIKPKTHKRINKNTPKNIEST